MFQPSKELTVTEGAHPCLSKWRKRIDEAERRGRFNWDDHSAACNWNLCATGEGTQMFPRIPTRLAVSGETYPIDDELYDLGARFPSAVRPDEKTFALARSYITRIENRLAELSR